MAERYAVITGMGLVTPLGIGVDENWTNLSVTVWEDSPQPSS